MRYNGGKKRIAKKLAAIIQRTSPQIYWEPFCGMCSVGLQIQARRKFFSDTDRAVIAVVKAAITGQQFPEILTEKEYQLAKLLPENAPLHGFAKYGCSFAGKPWGGYARSGVRNYAQNAANALRVYTGRTDLELFWADYRAFQPPEPPDVIYCDPPYAGTTTVGSGGKFDSLAFWHWASQQQATVFVSEYRAPIGWREVFAEEITDGLVPKTGRNVERLFVRD